MIVDTDKIVALLDEAYTGRINDLSMHSTQLANHALVA
jgi:hypothetical protein